MTATNAMPKQKQCQETTKPFKSPTKFKMNRCPTNVIVRVIILASLPYSSTLNLPSGDPAPGRSPGPPVDIFKGDLDKVGVKLETNIKVPIDDVVYDEVTTDDEIATTVSEASVSERIVGDACAFARIPSDSEDIVTLGERNSDINVTFSHSIFEAEELVKGFVYDVHLQLEEPTLRDYVLYSIVGNYIRGNFTPTSFSERPCRDEEPLPYFKPKHGRTARSKHVKTKWHNDDSDSYRTRSDSDFEGYYFRPKFRSRVDRSIYKFGKMRYRFLPAAIVSGPLEDRNAVMLQWSLNDASHLDDEETSVVFRLRYRKTTSTTIYQVFFTKTLRLDCVIHVRAARSGRVHSGHLPRTRGCRLLFPLPSPKNAILIELHKLNVPCSSGYLKFAPSFPPVCGKLEQIAMPNRRHLYQSSGKPEIEIHGRPTFAATYRLVDHCHDVLLTERNGSFEVGPTIKLFCSYKIHLPYGNRVALRLQMGTGPMIRKDADNSNIIHEDGHIFCKGMELNLVDGDSRWKHCSQPGDPLRSVQIISERNSVRLNISILAKKNSSAMWLKVWWMDKPIEEIIGHCDFGWVVSGDFCITSVRETKSSWRQSELECVRMGGHLTSILNERQQQIMDQLLIHTPGAGVDDVYWIGATDSVHEGEFRWSDGLPFSYAHWFPGWRKHAGQPNDDGTSGQDCVEARRELPPRPAHPTFMWNDRSCRERNYYVCERPGVEDPYKASKVQCNESIVLSHLHPQATISSPGFPRPYPDDVNCVTEIKAPPAHTIRLHFEELLTEHEPHCSYDFLNIIESGLENFTEHAPAEWMSHEHHFGSENEVWEELETSLPESDAVSAGWSRDTHATRDRRLCGDWSGKLKLLRYQSRGNALRLKFKSDHSRHFAGYRAKVTLTDTQSCLDVKQVLFNGYCYLFSGYPQASWSTAKQVCEGLNMHLSSIHTPEEERFIVTGIRQSSDYSAGVVYWLGSRLDSNEISWIDGSTLDYQAWPPYNDTEEVEDACLGVQWKTSPVPSQPSGLYWTSHKCTATGGYVCRRRLNSEHVLRNTTVEGTSGTLVSPNYPGLYDNDLDYWVHVRGATDTRLVFVFTTIDLEYQNDCLYDFIELRDRKVISKSSRYCGSVGETRWVATSNEAILHFHSDYNTQGLGFSVNWHAVELTGCPSQTFTSKEGILHSPNYPHFLLPDMDCTIDILAPAGKRVLLNISFFDFGYGLFKNGVPINVSETIPEENYLQVQVDPASLPIRSFQNSKVLSNGLFVSQSETMRIRLKTGENVTGLGFFAHFKTVWHVNVSNTISLSNSGRLASLNYPGKGPFRATLRTRLVAPHGHTLAASFSSTVLVPARDSPCGVGEGWIEVIDSYTDNNGTQWTLCEVNRRKRALEKAPLVITSYLHSLVVTQHAGEEPMEIDVAIVVHVDSDYHSKLLLLPEETNLESCYPNPCTHGGQCSVEDSKNTCQCTGYHTGVFCLLTACERSPCVNGNCSLSAAGATCACARGWRGRRCAERVRPCAARPCNHRGACVERDAGFLCQCNPSWKGKRCEIPNPTPNIVGLGTRMMQEPFWLGLFAVFVVLGFIGLIWCGKRHFPEKIEKLLAEEADRCARPRAGGSAGVVAGGGGAAPGAGGAEARTLLTRLGIRKPSVTGAHRRARTFSLDDLLKPPPGRSPSPRKKRNNSTPTKKNAAEKKQILQQLISPAPANDHSKKITMGELIQMSEKRTLSTVESAPAFVEYGLDNKDTSFASEASSPSTSPSMRQISDPKLEKKVTFARLLNKVSAEMSSSSDVDMVNTIAIPMALIADRTIRTKASSTPPSPGVEVRSPHSTSSNQGSDSMSSLDLNLANAALKKYSRAPKISSADSILAMFRNFSSSAAIVSRASSGGISASSTPTASSPQDDTVDADDLSIASSHIPSLAPDSPISRPHTTIEIQVVDPLSSHKPSSSGNLLHPPSILLEVPSSINKCLSPIRELPTPLPTPLPSPRMSRIKLEQDIRNDSIISCMSPSEDELDDIRCEKPERPTSGLRLKLRQPAIYSETPTPSTHVTDSPSPSFTHSQDSEREMSSPSPAPPLLKVPVLTIERPSPGSPPPRRTPPHLDYQPPPLITVTYNASEESDEPMSPRPPPPTANMCYLSPFSMSARGERAPSESNLSSSGYSSMASPGPSRCGSSNPLCPSEMEDPGSGGGPSCFQSRRRPLMKTNSSPAASNDGGNERRRGRSDSETLSDDPLLESNDEGIGTDERVDDVPSSAKEMETLASLKECLDLPQTTLCSPIGVTKCSIVKCISVERGLDEKASLKPPVLFSDCSRPLSPVSSRSESPLSDKTGLGRFSPQFYGRQLPFTDSDGLYDFPSSECVKGGSCKNGSTSHRKAGRRRDRRTTRTTSHEPTGTTKTTLPHMPHSMHNLLEVPYGNRGRKGGRRRSRSQAPAVATSSSSEESVSNASVASVASARELRLPDLEMQPEPARTKKPLRRQKCRSSEDTSSKISSSLDLTEDSRKPNKVSKLRTIGNQIRFLRRLEKSLKMKESYPAISDDEGDESSSVTSPLLQGRKELSRKPGHAISAPLLGAARPKISRQRRYDKSLLNEETRTLSVTPGYDNSD